MPSSKKIQTLGQEIFRRLHNTKHEIKWELKVEILEKFMTELKASGYSEKDGYEILKSGIGSYNNLRRQEEEGKRPFFRNKNFQRNRRNHEKETKKGCWFKHKDNKYSTVFFVPPTPGSHLMKMLKKTEDQYKIGENNRIKFVETCSRKYVDYFRNSNPFNIKCKPSDKCFVCDSDSVNNSDCKTTNIGYSIKCKLCKEKGKDVSYEGESARSAHLRGNKHLSALRNKRKTSVLYKHVIDAHKEEQSDVKFEMNVVGKFVSCLSRQIEESIRIRSKPPSLLLNSKSEYHGPCIKRKVLEK